MKLQQPKKQPANLWLSRLQNPPCLLCGGDTIQVGYESQGQIRTLRLQCTKCGGVSELDAL